MQQLLSGLTTRVIGRNAIYLPVVETSTNDLLKRGGYLDGTLLYTLDQRGGKGRRGKHWEQKAGEGIALSVLLDQRQEMQLLPLCAALAVTRALESLCPASFQIKWPNDILCNGKKICGILCESVTQLGQTFFICGIGINLSQGQETFQALSLPYATSLRLSAGYCPPAERVVSAVANQLESFLTLLERGEWEALRSAYQAKCVNLHRQVQAVYGNEVIVGRAVEIDQSGGLVIQTDAGRRTVCAGEVSVRGLYGYW